MHLIYEKIVQPWVKYIVATYRFQYRQFTEKPLSYIKGKCNKVKIKKRERRKENQTSDTQKYVQNEQTSFTLIAKKASSRLHFIL